jgi:hypothetical protein
MELEDGETGSRLSVGRNLQISVFGDNTQARQALFSALRQWANDIEAPAWQRVWLRLTDIGIHWAVVVVGVTVLSAIDLAIEFFGRSSLYKNAAHALLAKGVGTKDLTKAIEIILALESNYNPSPRAETWWAQELQLALVVFGVMLAIRPRLEIGLGKGRRRIVAWTWWMRFVAISLPLFIITTAVRSLLQKVLHLG